MEKIESNPMIEEFLDDKASEMIDDINDDAKADLLLFFMYKTAQHMRIIVGALAIWSIVGACVLFAVILNLIWG